MSAINWQELRHAYGAAGDVPGWLRGLGSDDAAERDEAIGALWSALCHQETVYSASAAAVPFLVRAARSPVVDELQRFLVLSLVVYIGRGEDSVWKGYTTWEEVEACTRAVAAVAPEMVRWSATDGVAARAAGLALCVYFPHALKASGTTFAVVTDGLTEPRLVAACRLAKAIIAGEPLDEVTIRAAAATDAETLDYFDQAFTDFTPNRRARAVVLELLTHGVEAALGPDE